MRTERLRAKSPASSASRVRLVPSGNSTYSHEPTEHAHDKPAPLPGWAGLHDNDFVAPAANTGRLTTTLVTGQALLPGAGTRLRHATGGRATIEEDARLLLGWAKELGCNFAQGWLYGRAVPSSDFSLMLERSLPGPGF